MTGRILGAAIAIVLANASAALAQLAEPSKTDQFVGAFLQQAGDDAGWAGGVTSRGGFDFAPNQRMRVGWQLDYGSRGKRETATGAVPKKEPDVSKNAGTYTVGYVRRFGGPTWLVAADAGAEHKRTATATGESEHSVGFLGNASIRNVGSRKLGDQQDPQLDWALKLNLATADAIGPDGTEGRELFVDPVTVLWLSFGPRVMTGSDGTQTFTYWFVARAQAGAMHAFDDTLETAGQWEASLTFFFTPNSGIMLRRFDGHFEHNLRDRKHATSLNVVWKFG